MITNYEKLLKQVTSLQRKLMDIEDYSEEAYELIERLIDELEYQLYELKEGNYHE